VIFARFAGRGRTASGGSVGRGCVLGRETGVRLVNLLLLVLGFWLPRCSRGNRRGLGILCVIDRHLLEFEVTAGRNFGPGDRRGVRGGDRLGRSGGRGS
jgi:hypothetical protein